MNTLSQIILHNVDRIETRLSCINGHWHREILVMAGEHEMKLTLHDNDSECGNLELLEQRTEYVHVENYDPRVERSNAPLLAADEGAKQ